MYAEYLRNYDQSQALLLRLQAKHKEFKAFMEVGIIRLFLGSDSIPLEAKIMNFTVYIQAI